MLGSEKMFSSKKILGPEKSMSKIFWVRKNFLVKNDFWSNQILGQKILDPHKFWIENNFGPKNFWLDLSDLIFPKLTWPVKAWLDLSPYYTKSCPKEKYIYMPEKRCWNADWQTTITSTHKTLQWKFLNICVRKNVLIRWLTDQQSKDWK